MAITCACGYEISETVPVPVGKSDSPDLAAKALALDPADRNTDLTTVTTTLTATWHLKSSRNFAYSNGSARS